MYKFTVFVPLSHINEVIGAISKGGGGHIGNYSKCTFRSQGIGTYQPEEGANPYVGHVGQFEEADEVRLEALVPESCLKSVLSEVKRVHPYEEMAYDVYPLRQLEPNEGLGVIGRLPKRIALGQLAKIAAKFCGSKSLCCSTDRSKKISRLAIITGSAGSSVDSINTSIAEAVLTGELSYHRALDLVKRGVGLICLGHAASEKVVAPTLARLAAEKLEKKGAQVRWHIFDDYSDPCANL